MIGISTGVGGHSAISASRNVGKSQVHFEHNYGHGEQNLSVPFAVLMMFAFLVDQTQELFSPLSIGSKKL